MPPKAADREGRRHPISFRATEDVRDRLERAASEAGRSLTQEIEYRLEQSFLQSNIFKSYFGAEDADEIMREINLIVIFNLARLGKPLKGNEAAIDALRSQIDGLLVSLKDKESYDAKKAAWEAMIEHDLNAWKDRSVLQDHRSVLQDQRSQLQDQRRLLQDQRRLLADRNLEEKEDSSSEAAAAFQHIRSTKTGKTNVRKAR